MNDARKLIEEARLTSHRALLLLSQMGDNARRMLDEAQSTSHQAIVLLPQMADALDNLIKDRIERIPFSRPIVANGTLKLEDRLLSNMLLNEKTGCLEWQGSRNESGYGVVSLLNKSLLVHRLMYELFKGPIILETPQVLHDCDNPPCGNPNHLHLGTNSMNIKEAFERGLRKGIYGGVYKKNGRVGVHHVLSREQVVEIRRRYAAGENKIDLSIAFNVTAQTIMSIVHRRTWAHVP